MWSGILYIFMMDFIAIFGRYFFIRVDNKIRTEKEQCRVECQFIRVQHSIGNSRENELSQYAGTETEHGMFFILSNSF